MHHTRRNLKEDDRLLINSRPSFWSSKSGSENPLDVVSYPHEITAVNVQHGQEETTFTDTSGNSFGWCWERDDRPGLFKILDNNKPKIGDIVVCVKAHSSNPFKPGVIAILHSIDGTGVPYKIQNYDPTKPDATTWCVDVRLATKEEIAASHLNNQSKPFPEEGSCKDTHPEILQYLELTRSYVKSMRDNDKEIGFAWNRLEYWPIYANSSKQLYSNENLLLILKPFNNEVFNTLTERRRTESTGTRATRQKIRLTSSERLVGSRIANLRRRAQLRYSPLSKRRIFFDGRGRETDPPF